MEGIRKDNIINEDTEIIKVGLLEKIFNSNIKKCICKIINLESKKEGTGFFCNIK